MTLHLYPSASMPSVSFLPTPGPGSPSPALPPSRAPSFSSSHWTPSLPPCWPLPPRQPPRPPWLPSILVLAAYLLPFTVYYPFHSPMCSSMFPIPLDTVSKMKNSLRISLYVPGSIHHQRQRSHHQNQSRLAASQWSLPQNAEFVHPRWCSSVETRDFGRH